jgi:hypothetical protein
MVDKITTVRRDRRRQPIDCLTSELDILNRTLGLWLALGTAL